MAHVCMCAHTPDIWMRAVICEAVFNAEGCRSRLNYNSALQGADMREASVAANTHIKHERTTVGKTRAAGCVEIPTPGRQTAPNSANLSLGLHFFSVSPPPFCVLLLPAPAPPTTTILHLLSRSANANANTASNYSCGNKLMVGVKYINK